MRIYSRLTLSLTFLLLFAFSLNDGFAGAGKKWKKDAAHTSIGFSIKHFFTPVKGSFEDFNIDLNFDPSDLENSSINVEIKIASVSTANEKRDNHLKTADWFEAQKYPTMSFKSSKIESKGDNKYIAHGKLKIKNVEKDIMLPFTLLGVKELPKPMQERMGATEVAGFHATFTLDRNDYDVGTGSWAATAVVGDEVNIDIALEVHH